jgi:hypothetical protein
VAWWPVEEAPWGDGKRTLTKVYMRFLARWARRLSWKETADCFRASWDKVFDAVEHVVTWGLEHRMLGQIDAIGVDEIQYAKGHKMNKALDEVRAEETRRMKREGRHPLLKKSRWLLLNAVRTSAMNSNSACAISSATT